MSLNKDSVLANTNFGLDVFRHFLGYRFTDVGKSFKNPFYQDTKASCYVYRDAKSGKYLYKDFGDPEFMGDCFHFVSKLVGRDCQDKQDFMEILRHINNELRLNLEDQYQRSERVIDHAAGRVTRASRMPAADTQFETVKAKDPIEVKPFSGSELSFWLQYGISEEVLRRFNVISIRRFNGVGKEGNEYVLNSSESEPIFGYLGLRHTKLYRPHSRLRFLYSGEKMEHYVFGQEQLPLRGDILFITGGEKDVLSLVSHGFNAVCLNSETSQIPKNLLRSLGYRFKHITLLYDADETGIKSMARLVKEYKDFGLKSLLLPLPGEKSAKDVSDFFRLGNTQADLMMLFREMLDELYQETIAVMRTCEINFDNPPPAPDPMLSVNEVTIGSPGNLVCIAGSEGSGKTNYLGGILSGAIKPGGIEIDTLGTTVRENIHDHAVLLYDTEQSEYQLYKNLTYILKRSSLERPPDWFRAYSLVSISRSERMSLILESMDRHYYEHGGIHLVVIDGIADLLNGVNDEEPSVQLVEELFRIAAIYNTLIICVLHLAPSGMKLRGHLGSEVQRKAAGILLIEKELDQNTSVVKALKVREGSPLEVPIIRFGWSNAEGRHVYLGEVDKESAQTARLNDLREIASETFRGCTHVNNRELRQILQDTFGIQERTARSYLRMMLDAEIIEKSSQFPGDYRLVNNKTG